MYKIWQSCFVLAAIYIYTQCDDPLQIKQMRRKRIKILYCPTKQLGQINLYFKYGIHQHHKTKILYCPSTPQDHYAALPTKIGKNTIGCLNCPGELKHTICACISSIPICLSL